jgi:hypothetical protein
MLFLGHHKCASTLLGQYLVEFCTVNSLTYFASHLGSALPSSSHDVSFLTNASYGQIQAKARHGVHVIRNPLNVVLSAFHSHLKTHPLVGWPELAVQRRVLQSCSQADGKMLTVAFCDRPDFYRETPGPLCALRQWDFDDDRFTTVRMEDFGISIGEVLRSTLSGNYTWPSSAAFTFQALSGGREPGTIDETSHYRSGDPEQWRSELPSAAVAYVREHFRPLLERFYPDSLRD